LKIARRFVTGLAIEAGPESGFRSGVAGTPGYMAPEQIRGEAVDARSDLFALGVVLLESISGYAPFRKTTWTASSAATLAQEVSPTGIDRLSPEVQTIVRRAISRDPSARYESALAFLASLRKLGVSETTSRLPQSIASTVSSMLPPQTNGSSSIIGTRPNPAMALTGRPGRSLSSAFDTSRTAE
jgi:serine/threonine protein kinase